ncbi:MAG: cytochrome P450 [bacterium]|nr:cytochrome P450 [bacterium]
MNPWLDDPGRIFIDPRAYARPAAWHEAAARLRRESPIPRVESEEYAPFWALTRHADIVDVERQHDRFWNTTDSVLRTRGALERAQAVGAELKTLIHMDGAEHRAYRRITNDRFKPASLRESLEGAVTDLARRYVDRMAQLGERCDFAADVALYYPLHVIMSLLGVPESDEPRMLQLTQKLFGAEDPEFGGPDREATMLATLMDFAAYFNAMTAARRAQPTEDIASTIANATIDGAPLGDLQTISYYVIIATAGHDTTSSSLAGGLIALLEHPDQLRALRDDPSLVPNAVDEMIRWVTPVRHFMRYAQEEAVVGGRRIARGDALLLSYLSGNRDEAVFADPMRFDVRRPNAADHVAFGLGVHFCLGAHLARMELRAFLTELLARVESIELAGEPEYTESTFVGGPKRVPIRYRLR